MSSASLRMKRMLGGLVIVGALAAPAAASAAATTVNPAGHTIGLGSGTTNLRIYNGLFGTENCTISGGSAALPAAPANSNPTGPVVVNLTTRPTLSGCTVGPLNYAVTTSGTWSLSFQGGTPLKATLNIPANGLHANITGYQNGCPATNRTAIAITGTWTNGTTTPFVASKFGGAGNYSTDTCAGYGFPTSATATNVPVLDLTNPLAVVSIS